jgi:hypothetical protein
VPKMPTNVLLLITPTMQKSCNNLAGCITKMGPASKTRSLPSSI